MSLSNFIINKEDFVELPEILKRIQYCLRNDIGFSLIRIGNAENQVMSQGYIYTEEEIRKLGWVDNEDWTGIILPNYEARDRLIESVKKADMVGVLHQTEDFAWSPLTEKIFSRFEIKPPQICYAFINVYLVNCQQFLSLMQQYNTLFVGKAAPQFASLLKSKFNITSAGEVVIHNYNEIGCVMNTIKQIDYDLAVISAGSNAVILATLLAQQGKVAIDFGRVMEPCYWESSPSDLNNSAVNKDLVYHNILSYKVRKTQANIKSDLSKKPQNLE